MGIERKNNILLFLDFDGVICDSEPECFESSSVAYSELKSSENVSKSSEHRSLFRQLRPLIRSGEDYLVIQDMLEEFVRNSKFRLATNQEEFDAYRNKLGSHTILKYKDMMATTRQKLIKKNEESWLSLSQLFPHMYKLLKTHNLTNIRILSTKSASLVSKILEGNGIFIPNKSILHAESNPDGKDVRKLDIITNEINNSEMVEAFFIEDQLDHLLENSDYRISTFLADWGYILPSWLEKTTFLNQQKIKVINSTEIGNLFTIVDN